MPITLVTGLPGHGKTLYTLARWKEEAEKAQPVPRRVYYHGIKGLKVPGWQEWDVEDWQNLPGGALMIVDEAQFAFPVTGRGQTPEWVQKLATHRHLGLDFVLITQDPMLLDSFARRLVDRHFHVVRKFGTHWATIHEFVNGVRDNVAKNRKDSIRHEWRYPKKVFDWYESAEVHTVKARLPAKLWLGLAAFVIAIALIYVVVQRLNPKNAIGTKAAQSDQVEPGAPGAQGARAAGERGSGRDREPLTPEQYAEAYRARVAGLPHTAPIYDDATKPVNVPYPAACLASKARCQCYTQQATKIDTPDQLCRAIADGGFFIGWNQPVAQAVPVERQAQPAAPQGPSFTSLNLRPQVVPSEPVSNSGVEASPPRPVVKPGRTPAVPPGFG
ncbi:zonular occludens toxin domain-containing protein [Pelomonas sp. APW6]|uniref:Zonular occludens toxin domain-containing protein n=1 Tax=Roseateles subflavus TaxID=3053353 RepID=A0ABT7LP58_9BURK|nr:zonular occludens toxin domain-containing protein [Pelomonas sp. APW6]MDL5034663.1 zonular occludens toxin domain-containing protein [Pelomonas sp. APW6]